MNIGRKEGDNMSALGQVPAKKREEVDKYIQEFRRLLKESVVIDEEDYELLEKGKLDRQPELKQIDCAIDDLPSTMKMFEWSGISFGDKEIYVIYKAMKRLAITTGANNLRFWGKFFGRQNDYYVVEGELPYSEEAKAATGFEERGKGVNAHVYWVCHHAVEDWIQLPDVNPEHIIAARKIKYIVTGDLNAELNTNPKFPGKERHFLRAQIARIAHANTLAPRDFLTPHEENDKEVVHNEEFTAPATTEMTNLENWVHHYQNVMGVGRAEHEIPDLPEEERDEAIEELEKKDPFIERLKPINEDKPAVQSMENAWRAKLVGNTQQYTAEGDEGTTTYGCCEVRSLRWKGAITVMQNGRWANLYVGYGIKTGDVCFNPTTPQDIMSDPNEVKEQPEPTPLEAPAEPAPQEQKEGEGEGDDNVDQE